MNEATGLVIGIDGGGSKTVVLLADQAGNVLSEESGGPSNFQVIGITKSAQLLLTLTQNCCKKAGKNLSEVQVVSAGLSGAGRESDRESIRKALLSLLNDAGISIPLIIIESDARVALEGAFHGEPGIILISGTGSIAFALTNKNEILRVGGWGRIIGDEGSGYSIGQQGLNLLSRQLDGRVERSLFTRKIKESFGFENQESVINAVYRNGFDVATIAPLVIEGAAEGDPHCATIVESGVQELTGLIGTLLEKMMALDKTSFKERTPLAFVGGIIENDNLVTQNLKKSIEASFPQVYVTKCKSTPVHGALLLGLKHFNRV